MDTSRFFVSNLPTDATEDDLRQLFKKYGPITLIELKTKENILEPSNVNVFAFVTLKISADDAEYYLNELKCLKLRGAKLRISIAKESFLERLKRERAENEASGNAEVNGHAKPGESKEIRNDFIPENLQNTRRVFRLDEDIGDDEISADLLITKKRAGRSLQNGKIVIEDSGATPLHIIEKPKKSKTAKKETTTAEQKRKESLHKMKNQYEQKKNTIQAALSGTNGFAANKIKFSDTEDDEEEVLRSKNVTKTKIFGSDDEVGDEDIGKLKIDYGRKGEKLAKLQRDHQNIDTRFRLDAKFVEDDGADDDGSNENEVEENEDNERKWQLNILEQVVGYKLNTETAAQKAAKYKKMLRFDPSKEEHDKFLRQTNNEDVLEKPTKSKKKSLTESTAVEAVKPETETNAVSKEVFYIVNNTLTEALKTRGEGFSLLNMFGQQTADAELEQRKDQLNELKGEHILINKLHKKSTAAFNYESSSSGEDDEDVKNEVNSIAKNEIMDSKAQKKIKTKQKTGKHSKVILTETFFFEKSDTRLKEGANFFHYDKANQIPEEDYENVRQRLNKLIKKKIIKTKKNLVGAGRKIKLNKKKVR